MFAVHFNMMIVESWNDTFLEAQNKKMYDPFQYGAQILSIYQEISKPFY